MRLLYYPVVPDPTVIILPTGPIQGAIVGNPQGIECVVVAVDGVELSSVMIDWMGPDGNFIANSSRIIVNPVTSIDNNYTSGLHFTYLMEEDEGVYTCNLMILDVIKASYVEINNLTCKSYIAVWFYFSIGYNNLCMIS